MLLTRDSFSSAFSASLLALLAVSAPLAQAQSLYEAITNTSSSTACAAVHVIAVRASGEPAGQGVIGLLADMIATTVPGSTVEAIDYPALLKPYNTSSYSGTLATTARITNYVDTCGENTNIVLLGYSQGAHVVGDVMCGGGGVLGSPHTPALPRPYSDRIVAMIMMGDPRFVKHKAYDRGTAKTSGVFPRPANMSCDFIADRIQSYCDVMDPFCAKGDNLQVHLSYSQRYNIDAHDFVTKRLDMAAGIISNNSPALAHGASAIHVGLGVGLALLGTAWIGS